MDEKINKRSLKRKINSMASVLNFYSLLIMLIAMIISLGLLLSFCSKIISRNAANQMKLHITELIRNKQEVSDFTKNSEENMDFYKGLGFSYILFPNDEQNKSIEENTITNILVPKDMPNLMVKYTISKNGQVLYNSLTPNQMYKDLYGPLENTRLMKLLNPSVETIVTDANNNEIFNLQVKLNPYGILIIYCALILICFLIFLFTWLASKIIIKMSSNALIKPLVILEEKMKKIADGDLEEAMNSEIQFKKPIKEVQNIAGYSNIILSRMHQYVKILANQNSELEAQNSMLQESTLTLETINSRLDLKNSKLYTILNNVEQGFISFGKDLLIHEEYSMECVKIFGSAIENKRFSSIIYSDNLNMAKFLDELIIKIFNSDVSERNLYFPLLPEEIKISEFELTISYRMIKNLDEKELMIVVITDVTEKRELEKKVELESKILKMVVKAATNRDEFIEMAHEYYEFTKRNFALISGEEDDEVLRSIHTFKGNFSQFEMVNIVKQLEKLENDFYSKKIKINELDNKKLEDYLKKDLDTISNYLGKKFFESGNTLYFDMDKFNRMENRIQEILPPNQSKAVLSLVRGLKDKSLKEMLKNYPDYVMKLCERLGKNIRPFTITGDDIMLDNKYFSEFIKALVHVFRNAVDHGIESEDERLVNGKELVGSISCIVKDYGSNFKITISDDGKGIDILELKIKLVQNNIFTEEEVAKLTDSEIINYIFKQGISTKENPNTISGRGVGMSVIKEAVIGYKGIINVRSEKRVGTTVEIILPKHKQENKLVTVEELVSETVEVSKDILLKSTGLVFSSEEILAQKRIFLNEVTSIISLKGTFNMIIMISANQELSERLVKGYIIENIVESDIINYVEDVVAEISNTILGSTFGKFEDTGNVFSIGIPSILYHSGACIKYTQSKILTCKLTQGSNELSINMFF